MKILKARSPLRIDFVGMTDYHEFSARYGGEVVNATTNLYIEAVLRETPIPRIVIDAQDLGIRVELADRSELDPKSPRLSLVQSVLSRFEISRGLELTTFSRVPGGSGLGSSSTIATLLIALLNAYTGYRLRDSEVAELAIQCEEEALQTRYGWQDQYSPVTGGGVKYMKWWPRDTGRGLEVDHISLDDRLLAELESQLVIVDSGVRREAKGVLDKVAQGVNEDDPVVLGALKAMNQLANEMRCALKAGKLSPLPDLVNEVWCQHKKLHPDVTNSEVEEKIRIAREAGAVAARLCGAGGGGTIMLLCQHGKSFAVKQAIERSGGRAFDFEFSFSGVEVWSV